jgi:CIC family chloride channel protein
MRHVMFRTELYGRFKASDVMSPIQATVSPGDQMVEVMHQFESTNTNNLPVINMDGSLEGYISRNRTYSLYRKIVSDYSTE